jgi:hypothetical protein
MVTEERDLQWSNARSPMVLTAFGMAIEEREVHVKKARSPMLVTAFGMVTDEREVQPLKALSPMLVTFCQKSSEVLFSQGAHVTSPVGLTMSTTPRPYP